jgi:hypothetical protein
MLAAGDGVMRPVRRITDAECNARAVPLIEGNDRFITFKRDPVEAEPVGTFVVMVFRITGYDPDCDGSLMARLEHVNKAGEPTGWEPSHLGLYEDTDLVVESPGELWDLCNAATCGSGPPNT